MSGAYRYPIAVVVFGLLAGLVWSPAGAANALKNHPSPYLAMHGDDPIDWREWGPAALDRARRHHRLIFLSIGYFACHWCHVMQRESFQNEAIAHFVNANFVPVKVDRELEPALDARMIAFAEATQGTAGWPLNVFLTPDGHPLYVSLYAPPDKFLDALKRLARLWRAQSESLTALARAGAHPSRPQSGPPPSPLDANTLGEGLVRQALAVADPFHGGFGEQGKFPAVPQLRALLQRQRQAPDRELRAFLTLTLDQMLDGALQDHLAGGFFRYTVDPAWRTPHFEKMLYDNAQLARLYLEAAEPLQQPRYRQAAWRTLDFLVASMRAPDGGFISALSALDRDGNDGGVYLWTDGQLETLLPKDAQRLVRLYWGMDGPPPFAGGYLPVPAVGVAEAAGRLGMDEAEAAARLTRARRALAAARAQRRPPRDDKRIAAWNGLALAAFAEAARHGGRKDYRDIAAGIERLLTARLWDDGRMLRALADGAPLGTAGLEDYAYVADGLLAWARLTGAADDYRRCRTLIGSALAKFHTAAGWREGTTGLPGDGGVREVLPDGAVPAPSAILITVALQLAAETQDRALARHVRAALAGGRGQLAAQPLAHASHIRAVLLAASFAGH